MGASTLEDIIAEEEEAFKSLSEQQQQQERDNLARGIPSQAPSSQKNKTPREFDLHSLGPPVVNRPAGNNIMGTAFGQANIKLGDFVQGLTNDAVVEHVREMCEHSGLWMQGSYSVAEEAQLYAEGGRLFAAVQKMVALVAAAQGYTVESVYARYQLEL